MNTTTPEEAGLPPLPEHLATIYDDGYWLSNKKGPLGYDHQPAGWPKREVWGADQARQAQRDAIAADRRQGFVVGADAVRAMRAAAVPAGMKLVPVEPTPEMLDIGSGYFRTRGNPKGVASANQCYSAMLAAAPVVDAPSNHQISSPEIPDSSVDASAEPRWIPVSERLPECDMRPMSFGVPVFIKPEIDGEDVAYYGCRVQDKGGFYKYGAVIEGVTHWRDTKAPGTHDAGLSSHHEDGGRAATDREALADAICSEVAELDDRNSPEDWPEAMLVTHDELRFIVLRCLEKETK